MEGDARMMEGQEAPDVDVASLSDDDLKSRLEAGNDDEGGEEAGESSSAATDGGEGGEQAKQEAKPPTVEELSAQLAELRKAYEQERKEKNHWQGVTNRHQQELEQARQLKAELARRLDEKRQIDPAQRFIENPRAYHQDIEEMYELKAQMRDVEQREQTARMQMQTTAARQQVQRFAPDFETPEVFNAVVKAALDAGENPEDVQRFTQNPYAFHPSVALTYYNKAMADRKAAEIEARYKAELEKYRQIPGRIEEAARKRPVTAAAGGAMGQSGGMPDMSRADVAKLSDKQLKELLEKYS